MRPSLVFLFIILPAVARAGDDAQTAAARDHYDKATKAFDLGLYDDAVREYAAAYQAKADPAFLFNLGQAHRLAVASHASEALRFYRTYLKRVSDSPNRELVEQKIADLEKMTAVPGGSIPASAATTDAARCQKACELLVGCGVGYDPASCATYCQTGQPTLLACLRKLKTLDCTQVAQCSFEEYSVHACNAKPLLTGQQPCNATARCQDQCIAEGKPASCLCDCLAGAASTKAIPLLVSNWCSYARCGEACKNGGAACTSCFIEKCMSERAQCLAN
jgi:hypothetical protein